MGVRPGHTSGMILEPIFVALNDAGVRYVIVGGLATVLHGFSRLTHDVDLAVDLVPAEAVKVIDVLTAMGFRPRAPVDARDFARAEMRAEWLREKNMTVFSLWDPNNPLRVVDLFVANPIDFEELWRGAEEVALQGTTVRIASIDHLIEMKRLAGRPRDLRDIEALELIQREKAGNRE
jgi:predicted nucleotidyltransferase